MDEELQTTTLHGLVRRFQAGDRGALDLLIRRSSARLEKLAAHMLKDYPGVQAREETGDVLQSALVRLTRALSDVIPASVRDYYRLAAEQLRRELLDLARRHRRQPTVPLDPKAGDDSSSDDNPPTAPSANFDRWAAFQEAIEALPTELREVFCLTFYHGWTQAQIAELLHLSDRQIRRLMADASRRVYDALKGDMPEV